MTSRRALLTQSLLSSAAWTTAPLTAVADVVQGAPRRTALVIGNNRYRQNPLKNAVNDANAIAALLKQAGFSVDLKLDASLAQMNDAIGVLGQSVAARDVGTALFYYAGHAAQLDWHNYLLPIDGDVESASDIRKQCVDLGQLLAPLARARNKTKMIILDACRDDPFGAHYRPALKGMSQYDAPAGTLLAFATAPGRVAVELPGSANGLYTENLVRELSVKGVRIEDALKRVRLSVRIASRGAQVPWESTSLEGDVYLFPAPKLSEAELDRQFREEYETWTRTRGSSNLADWVAYLKRYPDGKFAEIAQVRMRRLLEAREAVERPAVAAKASALSLGPNIPVPARFKGSGNPNSAGTYPFRPVWTPGDEYTFHILDHYSRVVQSKHRVVVRRVDSAKNRVELSDGTTCDLMGGSLEEGKSRRFDPPIQINPAELQVGRKWTSHFRQGGAVSGAGDYRFRITGRENVAVPAGEFAAFKIEGKGSFLGRHLELTRWVVPGINLAVRQDLRQSGTARVLASARQAVSA